MFKILLLNPPFLPKYSRQSRSPCVTKSGTVYYPYYLAYATGVAEQAGFDCRLVDGVTREWTHKDAVDYAKTYQPNLIVLESSTPSIMNDLEVARQLKLALPNAHITMVNTHPTNMPDWTLHTGIGLDSVCRGEYDYTVRSLAQHLDARKQLNTVNGLSFKSKGDVVHNGPADLVENLDSLPFASEIYMKHFGEAGIKKYFYASITWPEIQTLTARGCPYTCSFCLTPDMPIITNNGLHTIGELVDKFNVGEEILPVKNSGINVLAHDGEFHKVDAVMKREYEGEMVVLKVQGMPTKIELTPNHRLYSTRSVAEKPRLVSADELKASDYVAIPRVMDVSDIQELNLKDIIKTPESEYKRNFKLPKEKLEKALDFIKQGYSTRKAAQMAGISKSRIWTLSKAGTLSDIQYKIVETEKSIGYSYSKKSIPKKVPFENGLLRLFGYFIAEGHTSKSKTRPNSKTLVFTFNKKEDEYIKDVIELAAKYFGVEGKISDTKTAFQILFDSTILADLFENLFGTGAANKHIPWEWLYLPEGKQASLMQGFFRGDGYKIAKRVGFNTVSKVLAEQFQIILNRMGLYSSLQITKAGKYESEIAGRKIKSKHDRYDVWVFGEAKEKLNSMLGNLFIMEKVNVRKPSRWHATEEFILAPITDASKKPYSGFVYNFSVEDAHSYTVHGIAVSNCNIPMKRSYRTRSVKNVLDEFEYIQKNMPFLSEVMLEDDTFPIDKKRTVDICEGLVKRGIKLTWSCNARVNTDVEAMQKMKKAGCRLMCVGFESPTQSSLNGVTKGQTGGMEKEFMKNVGKAGLLVNGCFILGLPTDTKESMQATINFAKELNPNTAQFYPLMVYPGTGAYQWAKSSGFLETEDFSKWLTAEGLHYTSVSRPDLSKDELLKWCNKARLEFYTNPKYVGKMVTQAITHPREAVRIVKGGKVLFKHLLKYMTSDEAEVVHHEPVALKVHEQKAEEAQTSVI